MIYSEVAIIASLWFHLLSHSLTGAALTNDLECACREENKEIKKIHFSAAEFYLSLVHMLFLHWCCKREASENRCFAQQRLVWMRFSCLIRMICTQRLCDKAGKFPHITLPLTEPFDLCGYYNSAQPDKHIIIAERKGRCLNGRHLPANVSHLWTVNSAGVLKVSFKHKCRSSFIAFISLSQSPKQRSVLSLILNCFLFRGICTNTWFGALPAHSGCALFDLSTMQAAIKHANKSKRHRLCINVPSKNTCSIDASKEILNYCFQLATARAFVVAAVILLLGGPVLTGTAVATAAHLSLPCTPLAAACLVCPPLSNCDPE